MKKIVIYVSVLLILFFLILSGCSGGGNGVSPNSSDNAYTLPQGNHALLGPLANADVKICQLAYTQDHTCVELKTNELGAFEFTNPKDWDEHQIVLVRISGGEDIDVDDDGLIDPNPTSNNGTLFGFAKVENLIEGNVNITVLTDIVYNYVSHLCSESSCKLSYSDLENTLNVVADKLVDLKSNLKRAEATTSYFGVITSFNPLKVNKTPLKFSQTHLKTLTALYHRGDRQELKNKIESIFKKNGLIMNNPALAKLKKDLKLLIIKPSHATLEIQKGEQTIQQNELLWINPEKKSNMTVQIKLKNLNSNYRLIKWMGCNKVSNNGTTCYINNLKEDRIITPVILPKLKLADNVNIVDITGVQITLNNIDNNSSISDIEVNSPLLDDITVTTSDVALISKLNNLKPGDIIVHKIEPVFYRRITSISPVTNYFVTNLDENINKSSTFNILTEFVPLTNIIPRGYISTTLTPDSVQVNKEIKLINSDLIIGDESIPFDPTRQYIEIDLNRGEVYTKSLKRDIDYSWETEYEKTFGPLYLDKDKNSSLTGIVKLRPYVDLNIGWDTDVSLDGIDLKLDGIYLTLGSNIQINGNATAQLKKKYSLHKILYKGPKFTQTFSIYGIPIKVTEEIPISYGIKGAGAGKDYDKAKIVGAAKITFSGVSNPVFAFVYNGDKLESSLDSDFSFSQSSELNVGANGFAYIGAEPAVYVYGIGVAMNNYLGPYLKVDLKAMQNANGTETVSLDDIIDKNLKISTDVKLEGSIGIGYYGRIISSTKWDNKIAKKIVEKLNDSIRGKYTEFWKEKPLYTVSKEFESSSEWGITNKPGELQVIGNRNILITNVCGEKLPVKQYDFTLKNLGDEEIQWELGNDYTGDDINLDFSKTSGSLGPGESTNVTLTISSDSDGISCTNTRISYKNIHINIDFKQKINRNNNSDEKRQSNNISIVSTLLYGDFNLVDEITKFSCSVDIYATNPLSWSPDLNLMTNIHYFNNIPIQILKFTWNAPENTSYIDGYTIFYSQYNNGNCNDKYIPFVDISDNNTTEYSEFLQQKLEQNKSYCFKIYGYKKLSPLYSLYDKVYFKPDNSTEHIFKSTSNTY